MTRKIQKKRRIRRQPSSPSVPHDPSEILSKLPAKSAKRVRNESFETNRSARERPRLLVCFREGDKLFSFSISQQNNQNRNESYSYSLSPRIASYQMTKAEHHFPFTMKTDSVQGLICFQKTRNPIVWNPSMRKFSTLPKPGKKWEGKHITVFLGYDPIQGKHKVVCMPFDKRIDVCRALTLGSDHEQWRSVETNHNHLPTTGKSIVDFYGRCINGVLYYHAKLGSSERVIMSFDVRFEKFGVITLPWGKFRDPMPMMMISYLGKLACVGHVNTVNEIWMWVLEDATKHKWSLNQFTPRSQDGQGQFWQSNQFKLSGATDDGELIYVRKEILESLDIVYIDPKRKMFRRVEYRGIVDDGFRRRNGLGDGPLGELQVFNNHIDTVMSL
ncbi:putative F-box protein At1g47730 [Eutrema salsugineum]|nr:putative F-box protein At1g47730 [Eutrema salsugineum]